MNNPIEVKVPCLCRKHYSKLIHDAKFSQTDPWQALVMVTQVVLFQAATTNDKLRKKFGEDMKGVEKVGCLACAQPDVYNDIADIAKTHNLKAIKAYGEKLIGLDDISH